MKVSANKGILYLTISSFVFMLSGYAINVWLGKQLGPINYGIYGVVISLMTAINIIQSSGLPQAVTKFIASSKAGSEEILRASLSIQAISTAVLTIFFILFANLFSKILGDTSLASYLQLVAFVLPFYAVFSIYIAYYNGLNEFKKQSILYIAYSIAKLVLVVGLVYVFHLYGAIAGFIISPIVALFFGFRMPRKVAIPPGLYKSLILFSLPLVGYAILSTLQLSIDLLFVKALSADNVSSGLYTAGQNIARIPFYALSAFALILFPLVTKSIHTEAVAETGRRIREVLRNLLLLLVPGTLLIALTSRQLLTLLYSVQYESAGASLALLVIGLAFLTILNALTYVLVGADRPVAAMALSGAGVAITSTICLFAIPSYGLLGAALGTTVGASITTVIAFIILSRRFPGIFPWVNTAKIFVAALAMYLTYILAYSYFQSLYSSLFLLPVLYIILTFVYGIILLLTREVTQQDLAIVKRLKPN
jgi:O-antigen/teichoic acid export membrane protein